MALSQSAFSSTTRWQLSAPESWVLLNGAKTSTEPFKLALTELLMRGAVRIVESRGRFNRKTTLLVDGTRPEAPPEPSLAPIWQLYRGTATKATPEGTGVPVDQLAKAGARQFGSIGGYVDRVVLPQLKERGLFEQKSKKVLFVLSSTKWEPTASGQAMKIQLEGLLARGRDQAGSWTNDPGQAVAFLGMAGAAVLLAPTMFPQLRQLRDVAGADFANLDFGTDVDMTAFDSMDSAFDSIDSSVDSGSDSGGSDSGGSSD